MTFGSGRTPLIPPVFRICEALDYPTACDASLRQNIATSAYQESPS
jgi:hypothetical protein